MPRGGACFVNWRITHGRFRTRPSSPGYLQALSPPPPTERTPSQLVMIKIGPHGTRASYKRYLNNQMTLASQAVLRATTR